MTEFRFYKNHAGTPAASLSADLVWAEVSPWLVVPPGSSPALRTPHHDSRYAGRYEVWEIAPAPEFFALGVMPCDALVAVEDGDARALYAYHHATAGAALEKVKWLQLGETGAPTVYLLHFELNPRFETAPELCRDEETQKPYPYVLMRILVLRRKAQWGAAAPGLSPAPAEAQ